MVVEDDQASRTALRYLLAHHGWQTTEADTLSRGIELLQVIRPHILFLDLMLPDGNGIEVLKMVRAGNLSVRVAVLTGVGDPQALRAVRELSPSALFQKPVDVAALLQWLDDVRPQPDPSNQIH